MYIVIPHSLAVKGQKTTRRIVVIIDWLEKDNNLINGLIFL